MGSASDRLEIHEGALLQVFGNEAHPVLIHGPAGSFSVIEFTKTSANPTVSGTIRHARLDYVRILATAPVHIDSCAVYSEDVVLWAPGSRFASCIIDGGMLKPGPRYTGAYQFIDATVRNGGVLIDGPNVELSGCEITGNQNGVNVQFINNNDLLDSVLIHGCNIYGNSNWDVLVDSFSHNGTVNGKGNWWGGGAAHVANAIDVSNPLPSAAPIGYRPPE
jgi:hypothetical protein